MATIHIDGETYEVSGENNLLQACLSLGLDIPYFCWHPALGSVGACRQCAVKQFKGADDQRGMIVMSCMTPVKNESFISIDDQEATNFRRHVIEWLMINHPHDCPVCAEGGHCHLQDMTVMVGHNRRRYRFNKRTHNNQYLGPFISHEMNRCIACYRCVRFYQDYAGGTDLGVFGAHNNIYFGREEAGVLQNEFSGNLVEVCPTGVFTDKSYSHHFTRKWDLSYAPTICHGCASGCNLSAGERYGEIRRIENRYHRELNHYFICDRGRFGYGYVNSHNRLRQATFYDRSQNTNAVKLSTNSALDRAAERLRRSQRVIGIGSARASLESNFALRELVGVDNFSCGIEAGELERLQLIQTILRQNPLSNPTISEITEHDFVLILGEDLTQTAPRIALAVRQAAYQGAQKLAEDMHIPVWHAKAVKTVAQNHLNPVYIASVASTKLDDIAQNTFHNSPQEIARFAFALAHELDNEAPIVADLNDSLRQSVSEISIQMRQAKRVLIISGESLRSAALLSAAANLARATKIAGLQGSLSLISSTANSMGLALMGGYSLDWALNELATEAADSLVVLENDLYHDLAKEKVDRALVNCNTLIALDYLPSATTVQADFILPAATFAEGDGTLVNYEGRAQRFFQAFVPAFYRPDEQTHESWRWLHALHSTLESRAVEWSQLDEVTRACASAIPALAKITGAAPSANYRIQGLKISRQPPRGSGRTALRANIDISEPRQPQDIDSPLAFSMEGYYGTAIPRNIIPFAWSPGWNSPQAWNKFQAEVGGHLKNHDSGVRLFEPATQKAQWLSYFTEIPPAFQYATDRWQVVPLYHLFGSELLSSQSEIVQTRIPKPYAAIASTELARLGLTVGSKVKVHLANQEITLPLQASSSLQPGLLAMPYGIVNVPLPTIGSWARLEQESAL